MEPSTPATTSRRRWQPSGMKASTWRERPVWRIQKDWRQRDAERPRSAMREERESGGERVELGFEGGG